MAYDNDKTVYLDYAATTPLDEEVFEAMEPYFDGWYGNPSSLHSSGRRARKAIDEARADIAKVLGAESREIIFTGSGTESDNLAILGAARANRARGNHIIISAVEHKAVLEAVHWLEREGFRVSVIPVDRSGMIDVSACLSLVTSETILISVMYANNEIGTIMPVAELAAKIKCYRGLRNFPLLHTDACQAAGLLPLDTRMLGVDLLSINGSKIYGPKGVGALYVREGTALAPILVGGGQERSIRAGTESVPLIVGMSAALAKAERLRQSEAPRLRALQRYFIERLKAQIPDAIVNGHPEQKLPNNVHITIPKIEGESMLLMLDEKGIEVATGSACSALDLRPSHVLRAIGQNADLIHGSIRFSLGRHTRREELDYVLAVFPPIVERLKTISALTTSYYYAKQTTTV